MPRRSRLTGTVRGIWLARRRPGSDAPFVPPGAVPDGRWPHRILAEAAGIAGGSWYAGPATHVGYELIGAGMLILAGDGRGFPLAYDELGRWARVGYERGLRSPQGKA